MESQSHYSQVRSHPRYKAMGRALVLLNPGTESLPFHIMDISAGGLSFRYLGPRINRSDLHHVSLYHDQELIVDSIPVKGVSDKRLREGLVPVRRGSLCFTDLSVKQSSLLKKFIHNFTEIPTSAA